MFSFCKFTAGEKHSTATTEDAKIDLRYAKQNAETFKFMINMGDHMSHAAIKKLILFQLLMNLLKTIPRGLTNFGAKLKCSGTLVNMQKIKLSA